MGRRPGATNRCWRILAEILKKKVVTETELLKIADNNTLNQSYKQFVDCELPIKRRTLDAKYNRSGGRRHINHRLVIYYVE